MGYSKSTLLGFKNNKERKTVTTNAAIKNFVLTLTKLGFNFRTPLVENKTYTTYDLLQELYLKTMDTLGATTIKVAINSIGNFAFVIKDGLRGEYDESIWSRFGKAIKPDSIDPTNHDEINFSKAIYLLHNFFIVEGTVLDPKVEVEEPEPIQEMKEETMISKPNKNIILVNLAGRTLICMLDNKPMNIKGLKAFIPSDLSASELETINKYGFNKFKSFVDMTNVKNLETGNDLIDHFHILYSDNEGKEITNTFPNIVIEKSEQLVSAPTTTYTVRELYYAFLKHMEKEAKVEEVKVDTNQNIYTPIKPVYLVPINAGRELVKVARYSLTMDIEPNAVFTANYNSLNRYITKLHKTIADPNIPYFVHYTIVNFDCDLTNLCTQAPAKLLPNDEILESLTIEFMKGYIDYLKETEGYNNLHKTIFINVSENDIYLIDRYTKEQKCVPGNPALKNIFTDGIVDLNILSKYIRDDYINLDMYKYYKPIFVDITDNGREILLHNSNYIFGPEYNYPKCNIVNDIVNWYNNNQIRVTTEVKPEVTTENQTVNIKPRTVKVTKISKVYNDRHRNFKTEELFINETEDIVDILKFKFILATINGKSRYFAYDIISSALTSVYEIKINSIDENNNPILTEVLFNNTSYSSYTYNSISNLIYDINKLYTTSKVEFKNLHQLAIAHRITPTMDYGCNSSNHIPNDIYGNLFANYVSEQRKDLAKQAKKSIDDMITSFQQGPINIKDLVNFFNSLIKEEI